MDNLTSRSTRNDRDLREATGKEVASGNEFEQPFHELNR